MSTFSLILVIAIVLRLTAVGWSAVLWSRLRDWRMVALTALLVAMTVEPVLTLYTHVGSRAGSLDKEHSSIHALPELLVGVLALVFVWLLAKILSAKREESEDLRSAQETLRNNEARLRVMLEQLPAVVWTTDTELRFTSSVGAALLDLGLKPGDAVGMTLYDFFDSRDESFPPIRSHREALDGRTVSYEQDWGGNRYRTVVEPLRNADGEVVGALGVALDVTDLATSEQALLVSKARYQDFLAQTSEGIWRLELAQPVSVEAAEEEQIEHLYRYGVLAECSDAFARMFGLTSASVLVDARLDEILPRSEAENLEHFRTFIRRDYRLVDAESSDIDEKGRRQYFVNSLTGIVEDGQLLRIWGTRRDVTAHREADEALKASEEKYRELFEASQDTIFISTPEGRLIDINPAGVRLLGYESRKELLNVDVGRDLYADPDQRQRVVEMLDEHGGCRDFELRLKRKNGSEIVVQESASVVQNSKGQVVAYRGVLRDVSRQRMLEEQLQGAQRMEAVGRLAGGVAHDFNNLLTVINGRSDLLGSMLEKESPLQHEVDEIKQAGERAAAMTRQLLILSRREVGSPQVINLNRVIEEVENLLRRSIGEQIEFVTDLETRLPNICADESQIEQVLLNLSLNARDAMMDGGTLTVRTGALMVDGRVNSPAVGLTEGPYVVLRVQDTGVGIDPAIRGQIFEPFVTTKEPSRGTGLGLSTVYGVVKQCGGQIRVESTPGKGSTFEIYLPAVEQPELQATDGVVEPEMPGGSERILLVEDEAAVRSLLRRFLDSQGYRVVEAQDGDAAIGVAESSNGFDLLLTDLVMPGMGGFELARRLGEQWPDLQVVFMSGYSEDAVRNTDAEPVMDETNFLQKPFSTDALARRLRDILDTS